MTEITHSAIHAAQYLKQGQLLAYPTESVWGIGCDPYNQAAVQKILDIKQRPHAKGMIVITDSVARLMPLLASLDDTRRQRVIESWQMASDSDLPARQAHTWLLPIPQEVANNVPLWITGQHQTLAVRVIAHAVIRTVCEQMVSTQNPFGLIVSTSCNPSGEPPASTFDAAYRYFGDQINYLQAETLGYTLPSQIRDATTGLVTR